MKEQEFSHLFNTLHVPGVIHTIIHTNRVIIDLHDLKIKPWNTCAWYLVSCQSVSAPPFLLLLQPIVLCQFQIRVCFLLLLHVANYFI